MPDDFGAKYPRLFTALSTLLLPKANRRNPKAGGTGRGAILACRELNRFFEVLSEIVGEEPHPNPEFVGFGLKAYERLGFSENAAYLRRSTVGLRGSGGTVKAGQSSSRCCSRERHEVFEALDIAVELFRPFEILC